MKKLIRLTESDLHRIVKESVSRILREVGETPEGQRKLGALQARKIINADGDSVDDFFKKPVKGRWKNIRLRKEATFYDWSRQ